LIDSYPYGFKLNDMGEPLVEIVLDDRLKEDGIKPGCLVIKVEENAMVGKTGREVMTHMRRLPTPFKVTFRVLDDDEDLLDFDKFTLGYYKDKPWWLFRILDFIGSIFATFLFTAYAFLPLFDLISDVVFIVYMAEQGFLIRLLCIIFIAVCIRGTILLQVLSGEDIKISLFGIIILFLPGFWVLLNCCGTYGEVQITPFTLESFPGHYFDCFWYLALCSKKRDVLPPWLVELFSIWFIPFYPFQYLDHGYSFITNIWIPGETIDHPLKLSFIFAFSLCVPQAVLQTIAILYNYISLEWFIVSFSLTLLHFSMVYIRFRSRTEVVDGFHEIRKHRSEVTLVKYLYTDFNLGHTYICSIDKENHLGFWRLQMGGTGMIGSWKCAGYRELKAAVHDFDYFEDKNLICLRYDKYLELREIFTGTILHRIRLYCRPVAVCISSRAILLGRGFWVCGSDEYSLRIFDHGLECFRVLDVPHNEESKFQFSLDGKFIAVSIETYVLIFTVDTAKTSCLRLEGHRGSIAKIMWLSKIMLITLDNLNEIRMWNVETGSCQIRLNLSRYDVNMAVINTNPKEQLLAIVHTGCCRLDVWDIKTWKRIYKFRVVKGVNEIQFCPLGIIIGDSSGNIKLAHFLEAELK